MTSRNVSRGKQRGPGSSPRTRCGFPHYVTERLICIPKLVNLAWPCFAKFCAQPVPWAWECGIRNTWKREPKHLFSLLEASCRSRKSKHTVKEIILKLRHLVKPVLSQATTLILWLMEPRGSMPHSQGLSNNPYPEPNQPNSSCWRLFL